MIRSWIATAGTGLMLAWATVGCAQRLPAEIPKPAPAADAAGRIVQVLFRPGPGSSSQLDEVILAHLADRVAQRITGEAYPLDAWAALCGDGALVVASPVRGRLARAVERRLALLGGNDIEVVEAAEPLEGSCLWIVAPGWSADGLTPEPFSCAGLVSRRPVTLVDLLTPEVDGLTWEAGELIGASTPRAASFAATRILGGRARGALGDLGAEAAACGIDRRRFDWTAEALAE